ncbi:MAG: hypothetical protein HYS26_03645 [Candidatus Kaiserbacteria bacterium]|nr:MAG: hypothetical protein HYS26_03645 [Candidatus Kaiserbacteria bacterium]
MLSEPIRELVERVQAAEEAERVRPQSEGIFEMNKIISKAASFYEKVRYLIDYREEHTIRRAALERILKRRVFIEGKRESGEILLQELVDGKYIQKEETSEALGKEIDAIITKFLELLRQSGHQNGQVARRLVSFAATEIDSRISPLQYAIDHETAEAFYRTMHGHVSAYGFSEEHTNSQLYCAAWRSLLSADNDRLAYALWLLYVPEWKHGNARLEEVAGKLPAIIAKIKSVIEDSLQWQLAPKIKNESIYFRIIREAILETPQSAGRVLESARDLDAFARGFLEKKYEKENDRIRQSGVRAVVYLFITKMTVALIVELPYELFVLGGVHYFPLAVNVLFHPLLLFGLTRRVGALDEKNTEAIIEGIHRVIYEGAVRSRRVGGGYTRLSLAFGFAYVLLFFIVFGGLIGALQLLKFNPVSIILFLFFLALVSYFAFRIRYQARRWKVVHDQGALAVLAGVLAVPIVRAGRWLSQTFSSINVFVLIMDFIIETPFKRLLNFSNQFLAYLREKADEMR